MAVATRPQLLLVARGSKGETRVVPFCYEDGAALHLVEQVAEYLAGHGLVDALHDGVAADRLRVILEQRVHVRDLQNLVRHQQSVIHALRAQLEQLGEKPTEVPGAKS